MRLTLNSRIQTRFAARIASNGLTVFQQTLARSALQRQKRCFQLLYSACSSRAASAERIATPSSAFQELVFKTSRVD